MSSRGRRLALAALAALALAAAYANHFRNSFHFDDFHTILDNGQVRSLRNLPAILGDSRAFSVFPTHQVYRPVVTASLALDYALGGGYQPFAFHLSTFLWFLVLVLAVYVLAREIFRRASPGEDGRWQALGSALVFALHPVAAETVNYVIQRGDVYSTLGVVGALALYAARPALRRTGLYLVPFALGVLAKPPALVFVPLLALYVAFFEPAPSGRGRRVLAAVLPSLVLGAALGWLLAAQNGAGFHAGGGPAWAYRLTQLPVTWHYFESFFAPLELSVDTDTGLAPVGFSAGVVGGAAFVAALLAVAWIAAQARRGRPLAFGILWFLVTLLPTAWTPLAEVANDHRMFMPFVGLAMAVIWTLWLLLEPWLARPGLRAGLAAAALAVLALEAVGTHARNEVWRSDETLWLDATQKSPGNARAWMNYGLTLMARADYDGAIAQFEKARALAPTYSNVEINLAIAAAALGRDAEAETHFQRGLALSPENIQSHYFYARYLDQRGRRLEALGHLDFALARSESDLTVRQLRMKVLASLYDWQRLAEDVDAVLRLAPADADALRFQALVGDSLKATEQREAEIRSAPTPERWVDLSLTYYQAQRYRDCIRTAEQALALRPSYAEALNNIAACHISLEEWDEAIAAGRQAVEAAPGFEIARNNLALATSRKASAR